MDLESIEICDLITSEIGPEELTGVLPSSAVCCEDSVTKERQESSLSTSAQRPFFEVQGHDCLEIFRFHRRVERCEHCLVMYGCAAMSCDASPDIRKEVATLQCPQAVEDGISTEYVMRKAIELWVVLVGLAAMLADHGPARCANSELPVNIVDKGEKNDGDKALDERWEDERSHDDCSEAMA